MNRDETLMRKDIHYFTADELKATRKKIGLNQAEFWGRLGITQSGGSRYESGRTVPAPIQLLLNVALTPSNTSSKIVEALRGAISNG